jgi:hypothetical protein
VVVKYQVPVGLPTGEKNIRPVPVSIQVGYRCYPRIKNHLCTRITIPMRGWGYHNRKKKKWRLFLALSTKERWHFAVIFGTYVAFSHHFCLHQNPAVLVGITAIWCNCTVRFDSNSSCDIVTLPHWICFHTLEKWTWASLQQNAYSSEIFISLFDSAWQFIRPTYGCLASPCLRLEAW